MTLPSPYACGIDGRASGIPLALWYTDYRQASPTSRFSLAAAPILGAFVACIRASHSQANRGITSADIRYGRTNTVGWVVQCALSDLGEADDVPPMPYKIAAAPAFWFLSDEDPVAFEPDSQCADPSLMYGIPNEDYYLFWSYERALFDEFVEQLEVAPHEAIQAWGLRSHTMQSFGTPVDIRDLDLLQDKEPELVSRLLLRGHRTGYHAGWHLKDQRTAAIFDATPDSLRALFLAEFFAWYAAEAVKRSGPDLAVLTRARGMVDAARKGSPEAVFESSLWCDRSDPSNRAGHYLWCDDPKKSEREHNVFEKYRIYAWRCAVGGVVRRDFERSLPTSPDQVHGDDTRWRDTADSIGSDTSKRLGREAAAVHPTFDRSVPRGDQMLGTVAYKAIVTYYDLYVFGSDLGKDTKESDLLTSYEGKRPWEILPATVQRRCRALLSTVPNDQVQRTLAACVRGDRAKAEFCERYLEAAAAADFSWWNVLSERGKDPNFWKAVATPGKLLGLALKASGKTLSGMVEARLAAHTLAFKQAQDLMEALLRQEVLHTGTTVDPHVHYLERPSAQTPNYRALIDVRGGRVSVTREHPNEVGINRKFEFELLRKVAPPDATGTSAGHGYALARELSQKYEKDLVVPVDLAELKQRHTGLPKALAVCAETLNLAIAVNTLVRSLQTDVGSKERLEPVWEVTKGVIGLVDSVNASLAALKPPIEPETFLKSSSGGALRIATRVVGGVDGFAKIWKGATILFSEDGDTAYELRHGREVRASLQQVKGGLQIGLGAVGILGALPATAALVGGPVGLVIAIGGMLVVAGVDQTLDATTPYEQHVLEFERALDTSRRRELRGEQLRVVEAIQLAERAVAVAIPA